MSRVPFSHTRGTSAPRGARSRLLLAVIGAFAVSIVASSSCVSMTAGAATRSHESQAHVGSLVTVSGRVTLPSGAPADNLTLLYFSSGVESQTPVDTTTDSSGHYSFVASPSPLMGVLLLETGGSSCAFVNNHGVVLSESKNLPACTFIRRWYMVNSATNSVGFSQGTQIMWLPASADNFVMPAVSHLTVSVVDASSALVPGAIVSSWVGNSPIGEWCTTDQEIPQGICFDPFGDLPRNTTNQYYLPSGQATLTTYSGTTIRSITDLGPDTISLVATDPSGVTIGSGTITSLAGDSSTTITLVAPVTVTGMLLAGANPVANASINFLPTGSTTFTETTTATDGTFSFNTLPGSGVLLIGTPGPNACTVNGCGTSAPFNQTEPPPSNVRLAINISTSGEVALTQDPLTSLAGNGTNLLIDLPAVSQATINVTDSSSSPVANALLKSNEPQAVTTFTLGTTSQLVYWSFMGSNPNSAVTTVDANGSWTLPVFTGPTLASNYGGGAFLPTDPSSVVTRPLVFVAADPLDRARVATQEVSTFTTSPTSVALVLANQVSLSASLLTSSHEPVSNATVVYVPAQAQYGSEAGSFYRTATTDSEGNVAFPVGVGGGTLYFLSGNVAGATCVAQQLNAAGGYLTTDVSTSPALPACSKVAIPLTVGVDASVTTSGASASSTAGGSPFVVTLPPFAQFTMTTVDNLTRLPVPSMQISAYPCGPGQYVAGYSPTDSPGATMFISSCFLGQTGKILTDSVTGSLSLPEWGGLGAYATTPLLTAVDPSNPSRADSEWSFISAAQFPGPMTFTLPDPPTAPNQVAATQTSASVVAVTWTTPSSNGGAPISSYEVSATPVSVVSSARANSARRALTFRPTSNTESRRTVTAATIQLQVPAGTRSASITGLAAGTTYSISVSARNAVGTSVASRIALRPRAAQAAIRLASTRAVLGAPFVLSARGGSGNGVVKFAVAARSTTGCYLTGNSLHAPRSGQCVVRITKAADTSHLSATSMVTVVFAMPPRPAAVALFFAAKSHALSPSSMLAIRALSKKLLPGAVVNVTAYAKGSLVVAEQRSIAAAQYLGRFRRVHVQLHYVTNTKLDQVIITTTKQ